MLQYEQLKQKVSLTKITPKKHRAATLCFFFAVYITSLASHYLLLLSSHLQMKVVTCFAMQPVAFATK